MLQDVLTYHVVPGRLTVADLRRRISTVGEGSARLRTVAGTTPTARTIHVTNSVWLLG